MAQATAHHKKIYDWISANLTLSDYEVKKTPPQDQHPDQSIWVMPSGGNLGYMLQGDKAEKRPTVQVLLRSHRTNYDGGQSTARTLYEELKGADISGHVGPWMEQAQPLHFNRDGDERHYFSINLRLYKQE